MLRRRYALHQHRTPLVHAFEFHFEREGASATLPARVRVAHRRFVEVGFPARRLVEADVREVGLRQVRVAEVRLVHDGLHADRALHVRALQDLAMFCVFWGVLQSGCLFLKNTPIWTKVPVYSKNVLNHC